MSTPSFTIGLDAKPRPVSGGDRPNKYAGWCAFCHESVEAGQGRLIHDEQLGKMRVAHHFNDCIAEQPQEIRNGTYTVRTESGHRTFRLRSQAADASFAPGQRVLQVLVGSDNDSDYQSVGWVRGSDLVVWNRFARDRQLVQDVRLLQNHPDDALESATCVRCNRTLTSPEAITAGVGPECAKKG